MLTRHCYSMDLLLIVLTLGCGSNESPSTAATGGAAGGSSDSVGANGGSTTLDTARGTPLSGGMPNVQTGGGIGGSATTMFVATGSVQNAGPPCKPVYGSSLSERSDAETVVTLTNELIQSGMVINQQGVFFSVYDAVRSVPLAGGTISTVAIGQYQVFGTAGSDLLLSNRNPSSAPPMVLYRVTAGASAATPTQVLTLSATETYLTLDERFLYLYDTASTSLVRASLTDGARTTLESGITYSIHEAIAYGEHLYWNKDVYVMRLPKMGGTSETVFYDFDLWKFDVADDKLLVGAGNTVNVAPLSDPASMVTIASVPSSMFGTYIDWMTIANSKVFFQDSNDGFAWANFEGTQCEGLFAESDFFGRMQVFQGYVYVQDDTSIHRMKLPQ